MYVWSLPHSINVNGREWEINTDYMVVLDVLQQFGNPDLDRLEQWLYCLNAMVIDFDNLSQSEWQEAMEELNKFIGMGQESTKHNPTLMDWEQDATLIIPEINKQLGNGLDVRTINNMHWWTFLGYYMSIGECTYSHILSIRHKRSKGQKLEKWERDYIKENKEIVELKRKLSQEEKAQKDKARELFKKL